MTDSASPPTGTRRERPRTGHPQVDQAAAPLDGLDELPVDEHARVYDEVDSGLRDVLATAGDPAIEDDSPTSGSATTADPDA